MTENLRSKKVQQRALCWNKILAELSQDLGLIQGATRLRGGYMCEYCRGVEFTEKKFVVITHRGKKVEVAFNFCPNCGRDLKKVTEFSKTFISIKKR